MGNAESPGPRPAGMPRWLALALAPVVGLVAIPAVHAGIPWALSHLGPRYGWTDGEPAGWNLLGYVPVAVGAVLLVWIMVFGFSQYRDLPERVPVDWSPAILMTGGPYAISRHPMYTGELAVARVGDPVRERPRADRLRGAGRGSRSARATGGASAGGEVR